MNDAAAISSRTSAVEATDRMRRQLGSERGSTADFLLELARFDDRRLWRELGYGAAFPYLRGEFKLSKAAAYQRLVAARLIQRYPAIEAAVRTDDLCLSSIHELAKVLTPENAAEVLPRFFGVSAREAAEVAASLKPVLLIPVREVVTPVRPDAGAVRAVRALTAGSTTAPVPGTPAAPMPAAPMLAAPMLAAPMPAAPMPAAPMPAAPMPAAPVPDGRASPRDHAMASRELAAASGSTPEPDARTLERAAEAGTVQTSEPPAAEVRPAEPVGGVPVVRTSEPIGSTGMPPTYVLQVVAQPPRDEVQPLDAVLSRLHVTVSRRFLDKLEAAKDRLAHACPGRTAAEVLEHCLDVALAEHAKRNGVVESPRKTPRAAAGRHVPAYVKREVIRRAGGWRCEWILENGKRCDCTRRLQFDHIQPLAHGGKSTVENVRLVCQAHNLLAARRIFGDSLIDRFAPARSRT